MHHDVIEMRRCRTNGHVTLGAIQWTWEVIASRTSHAMSRFQQVPPYSLDVALWETPSDGTMKVTIGVSYSVGFFLVSVTHTHSSDSDCWCRSTDAISRLWSKMAWKWGNYTVLFFENLHSPFNGRRKTNKINENKILKSEKNGKTKTERFRL